MDNPRTLGIVPVALTLQVAIAPNRLGSLLNEAEKNIGRALAERIDTIVRNEKLGYYPALEYFEGHAGMQPELLAAAKALAAQIRKCVKRDVQTQLWPVFSSVHIERATTLAFTLPRVTPSQPDAFTRLAQHYFPNVVRLELVLSTLDKQHRLEDVEKFTSDKVVRNLRDTFESIQVTATRRLHGLAEPGSS